MSLKKLSVDSGGSTRDDASVRSGASVDDLPGEGQVPGRAMGGMGSGRAE